MFGEISTWLFGSQQNLAAPSLPVSLHGMATISVPRSFRLERGAWNHSPCIGPPARYHYLMVDLAHALDPHKVTFLFRIRPRTSFGVVKDDGWFVFTLYRDDPGELTFADYHRSIYPDGTIRNHQTKLESIGNGRLMHVSTDTASQFVYMVDRNGRAAGYLAVSNAAIGDVRRAVESAFNSLRVNAAALEWQLATASRFAQEQEVRVAAHVTQTNRTLRSRGIQVIQPPGAARSGNDVFVIVPRRHTSGTEMLRFYHIRYVLSLAPPEARWLAHKMKDRNDRPNMVILLPSNSGFHPAVGSYLDGEEFDAAQLAQPELSRNEAHVFIVHSYPLNELAWTETSARADDIELNAAVEKIAYVRSFFAAAAPDEIPPEEKNFEPEENPKRKPAARAERQKPVQRAVPEELSWSHRGSHWVATNAANDVVLRIDGDDILQIDPFSNGLARLQRGEMRIIRDRFDEEEVFFGTYNFVRSDGSFVRPSNDEFQCAGTFCDGLAQVRLGDGVDGWIDTTGDLVDTREAWNRRAAAGDPRPVRTAENDWVYMDGDGRIICRTPTGTSRVERFHEGLAAVCVHGKWGYIDLSGGQVIPARYWNAEPFSEGLAAVLDDGGWTYIDRLGEAIGRPQWDSAGPFRNGRARVGKKDRVRYIGRGGVVSY